MPTFLRTCPVVAAARMDIVARETVEENIYVEN
jgi:hypothetical protein